MILIITSKDDFTADFVICELQKRKISYYRLNTETLPNDSKLIWNLNNDKEKRMMGKIKEIDFNNINSVWYRKPRPSEMKKNTPKYIGEYIQNEVKNTYSGLWRTLDCLWVNNPDDIHKASSKIDQMYYASKYNFNVPNTIITNKPEIVLNFINENDNEVIFKPIYKGFISTPKGNKIIYSNKFDKNKKINFDYIKNCPIIVQKYISKKYDIRVNIFGNDIYATEIHSQNISHEKVNEDWRRGINLDIPHKSHQLPQDIIEKCFKLLDHYDLKFGAFDFILTPSGEYYFLEINPNGQWAWIEPLTGQPLTNSLIKLLSGC